MYLLFELSCHDLICGIYIYIPLSKLLFGRVTCFSVIVLYPVQNCLLSLINIYKINVIKIKFMHSFMPNYVVK